MLRPVLRLTYERKSRGWSQSDLADRAALRLGRWSRLRNQSVISRLELSEIVPTEEELEALAAIFNVQPPFLLLRQVVPSPADQELAAIDVEEPVS